MEQEALTINGDLFNELRISIDFAMKLLINRMMETKIREGTVSAKIGIKLDEVTNEDGEIVRMPSFSYSIGMGMTEKESFKGALRRDLIMTRKDGRLMIGTNQVTMDEIMGEKK